MGVGTTDVDQKLSVCGAGGTGINCPTKCPLYTVYISICHYITFIMCLSDAPSRVKPSGVQVFRMFFFPNNQPASVIKEFPQQDRSSALFYSADAPKLRRWFLFTSSSLESRFSCQTSRTESCLQQEFIKVPM